MGSTIWHITQSLDGFIAGPDDDMSWMDGGASTMPPLAKQVLDGVGAILGGRRWYDGAVAHHNGTAGIYGGAWHGPVFVVTHRALEADDVTAVPGPITDALATVRASASGKDVVILGAATATQALEAGELDDIVVHIAPVLLGAGTRLIEALPSPVRLELDTVNRTDQLVDLLYRVVRS